MDDILDVARLILVFEAMGFLAVLTAVVIVFIVRFIKDS